MRPWSPLAWITGRSECTTRWCLWGCTHPRLLRWNVARSEPAKKYRASYRRFVYPAPNACWQMDATEYVLTGGRKCIIFQLQDDHSRLAIAYHVASGETIQAALAVVKKASPPTGCRNACSPDNGTALNPSRRGVEGQLVTYVTSLGDCLGASPRGRHGTPRPSPMHPGRN